VDAGFPKRSCTTKDHDPEKWMPVFRKDHAPLKIMIRKKPAPDPIGDGCRFSEKIMRRSQYPFAHSREGGNPAFP
jgi:hypothetical protein